MTHELTQVKCRLTYTSDLHPPNITLQHIHIPHKPPPPLSTHSPRRSRSRSCRGSLRSPWPRGCPPRPGNRSTRPGTRTCCPRTPPPEAPRSSGWLSRLQEGEGLRRKEAEKWRWQSVITEGFKEKWGHWLAGYLPETHLLHERSESLFAMLHTTITADAFSYCVNAEGIHMSAKTTQNN